MSSSKPSGKSVPRAGGGGPPRRESPATQIFATPGTVTQLPIVEVHKAAARSAPATPPPQQAQPIKPTPTRAVNEPTRIFAVPQSPEAARAQKPSVVVQDPGAPLLRAFDDERPRTNTWATAKTIVAPLAEESAEPPPPTAPAARTAPVTPRPRNLTPLERFASRLTPRAAKQIVAVVVAGAAVVALGTLVGGGIGQSIIPGEPSSDAPAASPAAPPAARVEPIVAAAPEPTAPEPELTGESAPAAAPVAPPAAIEPAPTIPAPAPAARRSASLEPREAGAHTLARQAVDALLGGDRGKALEHYRELSRRAPENLAYREAVRLLTASALETTRAP